MTDGSTVSNEIDDSVKKFIEEYVDTNDIVEIWVAITSKENEAYKSQTFESAKKKTNDNKYHCMKQEKNTKDAIKTSDINIHVNSNFNKRYTIPMHHPNWESKVKMTNCLFWIL